MNLAEFSALKVGDRIEAMNGSIGEVTEATASGVRVEWLPGTQTFFFSVVTTAWMHWRYAPRDCTAGLCYNERCRLGDQCLGGDYNKIAGVA